MKKQTKNNSFYSLANIFMWVSIVLILIPIASFIMNMITTCAQVVIPQHTLINQILTIIQLVGVVFWLVLEIIMFITVGTAKEHINSIGARIQFIIALILAVGPSVFLILLAYNVILTFEGINYLMMCLQWIEVVGFLITFIWCYGARSKLR